MPTEKRANPYCVQLRADDGERTIVGYGAVFYRDDNPGTEFQLWDNVYERIGREAFARALKEKQDVRGLFNHDPSALLGRTTSGTLSLVVDDIGLRYEINPPDTQVGRDAVVSIERMDVTGSSFAFVPRKTEWAEEQRDGRTIEVRTILDVDLYDVGPVTYPAYEASEALVRSVREEYSHWRDAVELERNEAARIVRNIRKAYAARCGVRA